MIRREGFRQGMRGIGGDAVDGSSASFELALWRHPLIVLVLVIWPVARGSAAVAGELERGTLDLVMSRPVSRTAFLGSQIAAAVIGLLVLSASMVAGNWIGNHLYRVETPPDLGGVVRAAINVVMLGGCIFGYTLLFSSFDSLRWRPNLIGSGVTLVSYVLIVAAGILGGIPSLSHWKKVEKFSILL
ncbi:MAG: hypothetical protein NVSMB56_19260 [Pyrinomonadaceae bacterium]